VTASLPGALARGLLLGDVDAAAVLISGRSN
jgi:hypothetical protein